MPLQSWFLPWVVMPALIFLAILTEVCFSTVRVIFITRGLKYPSIAIGFFQVLIWLLAIGQILQNLNNYLYFLAYGFGFSLGICAGITIEERLAIGRVIIRIVLREDAAPLLEYLKGAGLGFTRMPGRGAYGDVQIVLTVVDRHDVRAVAAAIERCNPQAFYTIESVKQVSDGIFPQKGQGWMAMPVLTLRHLFTRRR
ncbi:MAG: DUF5698 domain-containing protein [Methanomicrobiales archaeon]|nr:DUF5698 domain-containing protein [Methanomicrobiales archaeon]MDI6876936.1 DUF5698 domain-containing protein [Methanomicrobiales archaeon]